MNTSARVTSIARLSTMRRNAIVSALAAAGAVVILSSNVAASHAHGHFYSRTTPATLNLGNDMLVAVVDRTSGQSLPIYRHRGEYWIAGTPGNKYSVSMTNRLGERVLAVISVDGVNVLSGETAGVNQQGYVFNAFQNYSVNGWRKSDQEIASFNFVASPRSYAERTGRPDNVGTIGVAMFREKAPVWVAPPRRYVEPRDGRYDEPRDWRYRNEKKSESSNGGFDAPSAPYSPPAPLALPAPAPEPSRSAPSNATESARGDLAKRGGFAERAAPQRVEESLGTGHGAREYDRVTRTNFDRASNSPAEVIRIRYDSYANLVAMGVIRDEPRRDRSPNPFPESLGHNSYVPDPPRFWR